MTGTQISAALKGFKYRVQNEADLQLAVARALDQSGMNYTEQVEIGAGKRIDFVLGTVGVELKTKGGLGEVTRQLFGYAQEACLTELVLVTTLARHRNMPATMAGKPLTVVYLPLGF